MDDTGVGGHHAEIVKRVLAPAQKCIALLIARELQLRVQLKRVREAKVIDLHRMIDHELHRLERIDAAGIAAEPDDPVTHRGEIDDGRNAREVLQQDARGRERDFALRRTLHVPGGERLDVRGLHEAAVLVA